MSFEAFQQAVFLGFRTGFVAIQPTFPLANVLYNHDPKKIPDEQTYIRVLFQDLEGNFGQIGRVTTQTAMLSADVYVPIVQDIREVGILCDDIHTVFKFLVLPNNGMKRRLSKRDFGNSLGGTAHSRVSVVLLYDIK